MERRSRHSIGRQENKYSEDTELDDECGGCGGDGDGHQEPCINDCGAWICLDCVDNYYSSPWS
jgi:hypothetical protein